MFDKLFNRSNDHQQPQLSFNERRLRSRSAEPARKNRESDIFNRRTQADPSDSVISSEYTKSFAWAVNGNAEKHTSCQDPNENRVSRPATALSFVLDEPDTIGVCRSITLDQIAADSHDDTLHHRNHQLDTQLTAVSERLLHNQQPKYRSIYGPKAGSNILFEEAPIITQQQLTKQSKKTEYKSKFKPFSTYVYFPGNGWLKSKQWRPASVNANVAAASNVSAAVSTGGDQVDGAANSVSADSLGIPWYEEVAERNQKANQYRSRSQFGNPILGECSFRLPTFGLEKASKIVGVFILLNQEL